MEIPEDQVFGRPEGQERNERREGLICSASRIGYEHVEAEQDKQEKSEKVEQYEHCKNLNPEGGIYKEPKG